MSNKWEKEVKKVEDVLLNEKKARQESKDIKRVMLTNHVGKLKKKKAMRPSYSAKPPRNFTRGSTFVNYGVPLGLTVEEIKNYIKTGKMPEKNK